MSKIFYAFLASFFVLLNISTVSAENLRVFSREEWGANEEYRYWNSSYWEDIFSKRSANSTAWSKKWSSFSQEKKDSITEKNRLRAEKTKKMNTYLTKNFYTDIQTAEYNKFEGTEKLSWPIAKTNYVKNIVIHHTESEYKDSFSGIKNIYKYHALSREWGDVGYHYIIGYNGEIFEGRAGGDYVVAAHDTWNNYSTVGISIMGNYNTRHFSEKQYDSLKHLISHLTEKYGIDLNKKVPYHKECFGDNCKNGLETKYYYPIVGHKDGKATSCPGTHIYDTVIPKLLSELQDQTKGYTLITYAERQKEEEKYMEELKAIDWERIKKKFISLKRKNQILLYGKIVKLSKYKLGWKKDMLIQEILRKIHI